MRSSLRTTATRIIVALMLASPAAAQDRPVQPPLVSAGENGVTVQSPTGDFQLRIGALLHADARFAPDDEGERVADTFTIRRLRSTLRGRVSRHLEFYLNPDFVGGTVTVQDAYLDTVFSPHFRVRFGKTKTPFGLERLQSVTYALFFERGLPSALTPNRDVGVQVIGDVGAGMLTYQAGVMNGVADGGSADLDTTDSKDVAGRVLVRPFQKRPAADPLHGLALGFGATAGKQSAALTALRTSSLQQTIFAYTGATAAGTRTRYSPQASYVYKSVSGFFEYVHSEVPVTSATSHADVAHQAWQIAGSFLITGESATDGSTGVRPRTNFDAGNGHWGAFQIAARYHHLEADPGARPFAAAGSALAAGGWTVGLNWYLTPNVRYLVNVERTVFDDAANSARPAENAVVFRSQLYF
jgi:phosphate-selective porin OprO and OprP